MLSKKITATISNLLLNEGCTECYLFGSHATGSADEYSDIDIEIKGLPPARFFAVHSLLEDVTNTTVALIDFDEKPQFFSLLNDLGELKKIGSCDKNNEVDVLDSTPT